MALWKANVVVVLSASDQDHFAVSGAEPYRAACPEWAELTFLADHDISEALVARLESGDVDAVVFGSNALSGAPAQRAVAQPRFAALWGDDGPCHDVGVMVLHQYTQVGGRLSLGFLGNAAFDLIGESAHRVDSADLRFDESWRFVDDVAPAVRSKRFLGLTKGYGPKHHCVWTRFELAHPGEWERVAWEHPGAPLVTVCSGGDRVVAASRVPIDVTGEHDLLRTLLATCLRPRGCLVVEGAQSAAASGFTTALASALDRRRFLHRARPTDAGEIDLAAGPYRFFDELIIGPEWPVDTIPALTEAAVLRKLEQGGSLVATFAGPEHRPVAVRLTGQPQYAERANQLAGWLVDRLDGFQGDVWCMRGLAEVVTATRAAYEDEQLIPQALRADFVRRHLGDRLTSRVAGDNVDENVLATTAVYGALTAIGVRGLEPMHRWVDAHVDGELPSVIAHAITLDPALGTEERLARVKAAADGASRLPTGDDPRLLRAYAAVLFAGDDPARLLASLRDRSLGLGVQAALLLAVGRHMPPTGEVVEAIAHVRQRIDRLAAGNGALEVVCLGNAALIELARKQGIGPRAAVRGRAREVDARTIENTELVLQRDDALNEAEERRRAGRQAVLALVALLALVTVLAVGAVVAFSGGTAGARFGFAVGVFSLMSGFIEAIRRRARGAGLL